MNALILRDDYGPIRVSGYEKSDGHKEFRLVDAALVYDCPYSGETKMLIVNQAVLIPTLHHNLLCPMQLRMNDVHVDETPKFLARDPNELTHAVAVRGNHRDSEVLTIYLSLKGVTSYFPTRKPTQAEYEAAEDEFHLTYQSPQWDPADPYYCRQEDSMLDHQGFVRERPVRPSRSVHGICTLEPMTSCHDDDVVPPLSHVLSSHVMDAKSAHASALSTDSRSAAVSPALLSQRWGIGLAQATRTIKKTTQRGTRSVLHPTLSRRFRTNDRQLRYNRLPIDLYSDTLKAKTKSRRGNLYAQVFCARNGWKRAYPMKA